MKASDLSLLIEQLLKFKAESKSNALTNVPLIFSLFSLMLERVKKEPNQSGEPRGHRHTYVCVC